MSSTIRAAAAVNKTIIATIEQNWILIFLANCEQKLFSTIEQLNIVHCKSRPIVVNNYKQQLKIQQLIGNPGQLSSIIVGNNWKFTIVNYKSRTIIVSKNCWQQLNISTIATILTILTIATIDKFNIATIRTIAKVGWLDGWLVVTKTAVPTNCYCCSGQGLHFYIYTIKWSNKIRKLPFLLFLKNSFGNFL